MHKQRKHAPKTARFVWNKQDEEDKELHEKYGFVRLNARQFIKCSKRCCNVVAEF